MGRVLQRIIAILGTTSLVSVSQGAAGLPLAPPGSRANELIRAMLVCTADGCRHRYKPYQARPAWNGYLSRQHLGEDAASPVPEQPSEPQQDTERLRKDGGHRR